MNLRIGRPVLVVLAAITSVAAMTSASAPLTGGGDRAACCNQSHDVGLDFRRDSPGAVPEAVSGFQLPMDNHHYGLCYKLCEAVDSCPGTTFHPGVDFNGPGDGDADCGLDVRSVATGLVRWVDTTTWGSIVIEHLYQGQTWYSQYGHLEIADVVVGQAVARGDKIGEVGKVGATSCHLHWEIRESDHPAPTYGPFWDCNGFQSQTTIEDWYEDPEAFVAGHGPYGESIVVSDPLAVSPTRTDPMTIFALPDEYAGGFPEGGERNLLVGFRLRNDGPADVLLDNYGVEVLKGGVHQFFLRRDASVWLPSGGETPVFDMRGWITDDRLDGLSATEFGAIVQYQKGGEWFDAGGDDATATFTVFPRPPLADRMLVKRPRAEGETDPETARIHHHQHGFKWWITSSTTADNLFPGWSQTFYVYPSGEVTALAVPRHPDHDGTTPVVAGRNLLVIREGSPTVYILEPEPSGGPLRLRPFADEAAFWAYGYDSTGPDHDLVTQPILVEHGWSWLEAAYPVGSTIEPPAEDPILSVTPDHQDVDWPSGNGFFDVWNQGGGEMTWTSEVIVGAEWLHIIGGSTGVDGGTISFLADVNPVTAPRSGTIRVTAPGAAGSPADVVVNQAAGPGTSVLYVCPDGTAEYATIQDAIDAAIPGDVVLLCDGVYSGPGNRTVQFRGKDITVRSESGDPSTCVIDVGGATGSDTGFYFGEFESDAAALAYVTITNGGWATAGAVWVAYSSPVIEGCVFEGNFASERGGAVNIAGDSECRIEGCVFRDNEAVGWGGAIYLSGSSATIVGNVFEDNSADFGGAIRVSASADGSVIAGNVFRRNRGKGAALWVGANEVLIEDNVFDRNGPVAGGSDKGSVFVGMASPTLSRNTFVNSRGTAVWCSWEADAVVEANIITGSAAWGMVCEPDGVHLPEPTIHCNAFWENASGDFCGIDLGGNFHLDPQICVGDTTSYGLADTSPCRPGQHPDGMACGRIGASDSVCVLLDVHSPPERPQAVVSVWPNPVRGQVRIAGPILDGTPARSSVYDPTGRRVCSLDVTESPDRASAIWDGCDDSGRPVPPGVYFLRWGSAERGTSARIVLIE